MGGQVMTDPPRPSDSVHQAWRETIHLVGTANVGVAHDLGGEPKEAGGVETCGQPRCFHTQLREQLLDSDGTYERSLHSPPVGPLRARISSLSCSRRESARATADRGAEKSERVKKRSRAAVTRRCTSLAALGMAGFMSTINRRCGQSQRELSLGPSSWGLRRTSQHSG